MRLSCSEHFKLYFFKMQLPGDCFQGKAQGRLCGFPSREEAGHLPPPLRSVKGKDAEAPSPGSWKEVCGRREPKGDVGSRLGEGEVAVRKQGCFLGVSSVQILAAPLSTWEAEAGGSCTGGQPGLHRDTLSQKTKKQKEEKKREMWVGSPSAVSVEVTCQQQKQLAAAGSRSRSACSWDKFSPGGKSALPPPLASHFRF
ncbi:uncharacterized protein LOC121828687 [Peromyscus maniculatus bairdii]|uniref:uncharacterized protein LOC121828687 n=1 Tax=Peromyscus maniculatus bairdii TaxID=230844 RepID=UPI003FD22DCF